MARLKAFCNTEIFLNTLYWNNFFLHSLIISMTQIISALRYLHETNNHLI